MSQPSSDADKIVEVLFIIFLPPLAVWYHKRACTCHVCLNIFLLFCFALPSVIHAVWYCFIRDGPQQQQHEPEQNVSVPVQNEPPPAYNPKH
ncbi:hypothetical protein QR680_010662 [Steinernema hermaphroditum]|uniref:Uncharacterized protein n=1 Tax=Steinernema hermaphroditum TaxID=289476 RepID=A0AA39IR85_9BILA|nr:hypothetical protein QR680_010662 [Steinernema hermaphroditum]